MKKYSEDLKIGSVVKIKDENDTIHDVTILDIVIEAYIDSYKVIVKYAESITEDFNIGFSDYLNNFLEKIVFEEV